jgi:UDP:flavonoid glycosyltransferase YjiC (YdhE family)
MSRFLIASWDGGGNTPSAFNLGSRLVRRGHRVRMLGWATMATRAASAGIEFAGYPTVPRWPEELVVVPTEVVYSRPTGGRPPNAV